MLIVEVTNFMSSFLDFSHRSYQSILKLVQDILVTVANLSYAIFYFLLQKVRHSSDRKSDLCKQKKMLLLFLLLLLVDIIKDIKQYCPDFVRLKS